MTTYTEVFGSATIPPSDNSYVAVALSADTTFYWPEQATGNDLMADIMEVTPTAAWAMTFPAANLVGKGRDVLIRNLGAFTITIKDSAGGTIGTAAAGEAKLLYLNDNSTVAGGWAIFTFGTGTSAADASALAGAGLRANGSVLDQQYPVGSSATNYTVVSGDRAKTLSFTNSGVVTCSLSSAASMEDGFFVNITNQGTGTVTIDPSSTELVDGASTKDLAPGESLILVCNGTGWVTIGFGRSTQFQFTKLILDISSGTPFTLTSTQAQNKLLQFIGTVTAPVTVNVPAVVAVYYVQCSYTGAFSTTLKTAAGSGVTLSSSDRAIVYCDGVDVVMAQTSAVPAANLAGGAAGQLLYQSAPNITSFSAAGTAGQLVLSGGTGAPTWSDIGLVSHGYSSKATPVDADELPIADSAAAFGPKKLTWANLKATFIATAQTWTAAQTFRAANSVRAEAAATQDAIVLAGRAGGTGSFAVTLTPGALTASRIVTFPNAAITVAGTNMASQVFTTAQTFRIANAIRSEVAATQDAIVVSGRAGGTGSFAVTLAPTTLAANVTQTLQAATGTVPLLESVQTWTVAQRGTVTTDNDLSFDQNATNNFKCTPTAGGTLTFTNHTAGQSGFVLLVNGSNYAIAAAATTKISTADLTRISATGTYLISYFDDGTNAYCVASAAVA